MMSQELKTALREGVLPEYVDALNNLPKDIETANYFLIKRNLEHGICCFLVDRKYNYYFKNELYEFLKPHIYITITPEIYYRNFRNKEITEKQALFKIRASLRARIDWITENTK